MTGVLDNTIIQGNADDDRFDISSASATKSTVFGGKGADDINVTGAAALVVRGDNDNDDIDITASAAYTVSGGAGNDNIDSNSTTAGRYFGGKGNDTITIDGVVATTTKNYASGDIGDDQIIGSTGADSVDGGAGADSVTGAGGSDTIYGKAGADSINVSADTEAGVLQIRGGTDNDTILIAEAGLISTDVINGDEGTDVLQIDDAATLLDAQLKNVSSIETLEFVLNTGAAVVGANAQAAGITTIDATSVAGNANSISATAYTSSVALSIVGAAGDDTIAGGAGNDTLSGGTNGERHTDWWCWK